jgi:hypothetical protein
MQATSHFKQSKYGNPRWCNPEMYDDDVFKHTRNSSPVSQNGELCVIENTVTHLSLKLWVIDKNHNTISLLC